MRSRCRYRKTFDLEPGSINCGSARGPFHSFSSIRQQILTDWSIYGSDQIFSSDKLVDLRSHQSKFLPR